MCLSRDEDSGHDDEDPEVLEDAISRQSMSSLRRTSSEFLPADFTAQDVNLDANEETNEALDAGRVSTK